MGNRFFDHDSIVGDILELSMMIPNETVEDVCARGKPHSDILTWLLDVRRFAVCELQREGKAARNEGVEA